MKRTVSIYTLAIFTIGFTLSGCDGGANEPAPDVPTLVFPASGRTDVANALELQWNSAASSVTYQLELATDPALSNILVREEGLTSTAYTLMDLEIGSTYYWRLRAKNKFGYSDWTEIRNFTPGASASIPVAPGLSAPLDRAQQQPTEITFQWEAVPGAMTYHIQVSLEENFIRRSADVEGVRDNSLLVRSLVPTYIYFWRVRAKNPLGYSSWSPTRVLVVEDDF